MYAMDGVQRSVGLALHDGQGQPVGNGPGYVFLANHRHLADEKQRIYDEYNIELSNRWRGGLQPGDTVTVGGRRKTVVGRDFEGKYLVRDAETLDADTIKQQAYDAYNAELTSAWRRDHDSITERDPEGRELATFRKRKRRVTKYGREEEEYEHEPDEHEWEVAGPLSDDGQSVKQQAYDAYNHDLVNAWRRR